MKLFLCSHFSSVGSLIKEEIDNKKVAFIPTASLREGYTGYVGSARKLFNKLGAAVTEIDISTEAYLTIQSVFEDADVIYFTGGNSFFLMDQLRKTGTDELLKKELEKGKLMIGESAGAISIFNDIEAGWATPSWEEVVERDPDAILLLDYDGDVEEKAEFLRTNAATKDLRAIKEGKIYSACCADMQGSAGSAAAVEEIAKQLYPDCFQ